MALLIYIFLFPKRKQLFFTRIFKTAQRLFGHPVGTLSIFRFFTIYIFLSLTILIFQFMFCEYRFETTVHKVNEDENDDEVQRQAGDVVRM